MRTMRTMRARILEFFAALILSAFAAAAQSSEPEKINLPARYPQIERSCKITQREWQVGTRTKKIIGADGKATEIIRGVYAKDWRPRCKLRVYRELPDGSQEGQVLFDLDLALAHPATIDEANAAWKRWMMERSIEILKRNGYKVTEEHE